MIPQSFLRYFIFLLVFLCGVGGFFLSSLAIETIYVKTVSLEALLGAPLILLVEKEVPATQTLSTPIKKNKAECPPFEKTLYSFKVIEQIKGKEQKNLEGASIQVEEGGMQDAFKAYQASCQGTITKKQVVYQYVAMDQAGFDQASQLIIFVVPSSKEKLFLAYQGAYEGVSKKDLIVGLIKEQEQRVASEKVQPVYQ